MPTLIHHLCWKLFRTTFSSDLEEAMTESGESLSNSKKYCSVLEKISKINNYCKEDKLLPDLCQGFFWSEENVFPMLL